MVTTVKFSQFPSASLNDASRSVVGTASGLNVINPNQNTWTTSTRPATPFNGLLGYNTTLSQYEYWDSGTSLWIQFVSSDTPSPMNFTPELFLVGGSGNVIPTFSTLQGTYWQLGSTVTMQVYMDNSSGGTSGSGTGILNVGLPVTANINQNLVTPVTGYYQNGVGSGNSFLVLTQIITSSSQTMMQVNHQNPLGTISALNGNSFSDPNIRRLTFQATWQV